MQSRFGFSSSPCQSASPLVIWDTTKRVINLHYTGLSIRMWLMLAWKHPTKEFKIFTKSVYLSTFLLFSNAMHWVFKSFLTWYKFAFNCKLWVVELLLLLLPKIVDFKVELLMICCGFVTFFLLADCSDESQHRDRRGVQEWACHLCVGAHQRAALYFRSHGKHPTSMHEYHPLWDFCSMCCSTWLAVIVQLDNA